MTGLNTGTIRREKTPGWLSDRVACLRQWKSAHRLRDVIWFWHDWSFLGDKFVFAAMEYWRKQDRHLEDWAAFQLHKAIGWRTDLFRCFAAKMRKEYSIVYLENTNWARMQKSADVEAATPAQAGVIKHRRIAAVGELSRIIVEATKTVKRPAEYTSQRCTGCGHVEKIDGEKLHVACSQCGKVEDQDERASINLLNGPPVTSEPEKEKEAA